MMADITDHAVLRYLERAYGLDVPAVRAEMDSPALVAAEAFGANIILAKGGVRLVLRSGRVTTVLPPRYIRRERS